MGVPIVNGTPDDVNNLNLPDRSTVQDTYEQAIDDLKVAARLMENGETKREGPAYASKEAAWAMLSRIYLFMSGTYEAPNKDVRKHVQDKNTSYHGCSSIHPVDNQWFCFFLHQSF